MIEIIKNMIISFLLRRLEAQILKLEEKLEKKRKKLQQSIKDEHEEIF
jgi:predicted amino acid-binding ACT domain protein